MVCLHMNYRANQDFLIKNPNQSAQEAKYYRDHIPAHGLSDVRQD
jgi:hypothetical protein